MTNYKLIIALVLGLVVGVVGYMLMAPAPQQDGLGASPSSQLSRLSGPIKIGANGSEIAELKAGQCTLIVGTVAHAASTTKAYDCAFTGVTSTDVVTDAMFATTTAVLYDNMFTIQYAAPSTTAGFITVLVFNPGAARNLSATGIASTTNVMYIDN